MVARSLYPGHASRRRGDPPSPTQTVTNELLKLVAEFRQHEGRLLICATNFIRALDAAFLRHGRFDYVLPIGLPDDLARAAIWRRYIPIEVLGQVDIDVLVRESKGFTPADIEYAARRASQDALAKDLRHTPVSVSTGAIQLPEGLDEHVIPLTTADYVRALGSTRATVSKSTERDFLEDIEALARL